jgi:hypothetical protein
MQIAQRILWATQLSVDSTAVASTLSYLTTDIQALGVLAWISALTTLLGFGIAIWQIIRVKRAAEAAREAAIGMARRIRSRELLMQLTTACTHLEAARNHLGSGGRQVTTLCLDLSASSIVEAREIAKNVSGDWGELHNILLRLRQASDQLNEMLEPIQDDSEFSNMRRQLRDTLETLQGVVAQCRHAYDIDGD